MVDINKKIILRTFIPQPQKIQYHCIFTSYFMQNPCLYPMYYIINQHHIFQQ